MYYSIDAINDAIEILIEKDMKYLKLLNFEDLLAVGFLRQEGEDYLFIHLSFQEYLSAKYIQLNLSDENIIKNIEKWRNRADKHLLLSFVTGLIKNDINSLNMKLLKPEFESELNEQFFIDLELLIKCFDVTNWIKFDYFTDMKHFLES